MFHSSCWNDLRSGSLGKALSGIVDLCLKNMCHEVAVELLNQTRQSLIKLRIEDLQSVLHFPPFDRLQHFSIDGTRPFLDYPLSSLHLSDSLRTLDIQHWQRVDQFNRPRGGTVTLPLLGITHLRYHFINDLATEEDMYDLRELAPNLRHFSVIHVSAADLRQVLSLLPPSVEHIEFYTPLERDTAWFRSADELVMDYLDHSTHLQNPKTFYVHINPYWKFPQDPIQNPRREELGRRGVEVQFTDFFNSSGPPYDYVMYPHTPWVAQEKWEADQRSFEGRLSALTLEDCNKVE